MNRRNFLETICKAGAGILVAGAAVDLSNVKTLVARARRVSPEVMEIPINLEDAPDLRPVGGSYHLSVEDLEREILVVHDAKDHFTAVNIKCSHRGCDLNYEKSAQKFVCPCHGSEFDLAGAPLKGPATKPLTYYHAELKGDEVMVTVYGPNDTPPANATPPPDTTHRIAMPADSSGGFPADSTK